MSYDVKKILSAAADQALTDGFMRLIDVFHRGQIDEPGDEVQARFVAGTNLLIADYQFVRKAIDDGTFGW